jgi:hypothetical protein
MFLFESTPTRVIGVLALFTFIVSGVFAVADPAFIAADDDANVSPRSHELQAR